MMLRRYHASRNLLKEQQEDPATEAAIQAAAQAEVQRLQEQANQTKQATLAANQVNTDIQPKPEVKAAPPKPTKTAE